MFTKKDSRHQGIEASSCWFARLLIITFLNLSFVIGLFACLPAGRSFAQDAPRFYGEEVVVTAARMPQLMSKSPWNTTVITAQELNNFKTVGEALRLVAGVDSVSYGYLGSLNSTRLRGANASQVLILVDGRRVNSPTLGMFDMGDLLVDNVEKIEVVRAPLSAVYGSDAVSGAINIITKTPQEGERNIAVTAASFGTQQGKVSIAGENYLFAGDYLKSEGFRTNGDYLSNNVYGKMIFPFPFAQLLIDYNLYNAVKGVPGVPTSEADPASATEPNDRQNDKNTFASVSLKNEDINLRVFQNTLEQKLDPYIWGASNNQAGQTGIEWQQKAGFGNGIGLGNVLYGLEAREDRGKTTMSGDHSIRNYAAFVQDDFQLSDQHALTASIRGDKHSTAGTAFNPRLGWVYQQNSGLAWRASVGNAFRAPTLNELYWNDGWMFGNSALRPEKSFTYELGLEKKLSENSSARLSYYASTVTDLILWDWQSSTIETRAKNVGEAFMEGVEFEWERKLGERGKTFINYTYQKAVDRKDFDALAVGKTIRYTPQTKYNAGLVLGESSLLFRHVGERFADQYNTITLPAYTVVDLKLAKKVRAMEIEFSVDNLFNENYSEVVGNNPTTYAVTKYPMPGRKYQAGVKWEM